MGKKTPITASFELPNGDTVVIETGKLATQADGSVVVRQGNTMLFASVVSKKDVKEGQGFFPLSVDYQEKFAAAGRIPGNFFKREARLSEYEILISRLVDRVLRPLFPDGYMNETQIIINLISADAEILPDVLAGLAASAALTISDIPFAGPISEVRVARIDGEYVVNPKKTELERADLDIVVGATHENVMMVEGEAKECAEKDLVEAIKIGHEAIKVQCEAQNKLRELAGVPKRDIEPAPSNEELKEEIKAFATDKIAEITKAALSKTERKDQFTQVGEDLKVALLEKHGEEFMAENGEMISNYFSEIKKYTIREVLLSTNIRLDGRKPNEIRPIWVEVDYLPAAHGSAIFTRGETQALTSLTLGSKLDEQMIDNALGLYFNRFILHYNFPAYSVGEVKPMRGPGRREVGHANLAQRSLRQVFPDDMPYTIRIVSDVMESNGSSSMATVCAGSLSLLDAGIKIKAPVSGIAMGMVSDGKRHVILSDILGDEDALGDMDFKVTGTENGITGCQMDIKIDGLPYELLEQALMQAREGRLHILNEMSKEISTPREELKPHAPRMVKIEIEREFIGAVIGPGGKIIQEMQRETGTVINIEEINNKGVVTISGTDKTGVEAALKKINGITTVPEVGDVYDAKVVSVQPYGVFVEFLPDKTGLVHISEISWSRIETLDGVLDVGDEIKVKLIGVDSRTGKFKLSRKVLIERPPRSKEEESREEQRNKDDRNRDDRNRDDRNKGRGGNNRNRR